MFMKLPDSAIEDAVHKIEDHAVPTVGIREQLVQEGANVAMSMVAKWLAFTNPEVHKLFLKEFTE